MRETSKESVQGVVFVASNAVKNRKLSKIRLKEPKSTTKKKKTLLDKNRILRTQIDQIAETSLNQKLFCLIKNSSKKLKLKNNKSPMSLK